jgi:uncharacterized protein
MLRIVVDTNMWLRSLMGGPITLPLLIAWQEQRFQAIVSEELLAELTRISQRAALQGLIESSKADELIGQLIYRGLHVELVTIPPNCRDPKDAPFLAAAIDGKADAIVTGDGDMRADDTLREAMGAYGVELWGITTFLDKLRESV